jgi:Regulator of G protein signaling domain
MKLRIKGSDLELASILNFPPACALFEEFMRIEHAPENLYFWKSLERFEDICLRLQRLVERLRTGDATGTETRTGTVCGRGAGARSSTGPGSRYPWRLKTTAATATSGTIRYPAESCEVDEEPSSGSRHVRSTTRTSSHRAVTSTLAQTVTPTLTLAQTHGKHPITPHLALAADSRKVLNVGFAQLRDVVQDIMDQYVLEGSPNQVNLPGKMRVQLEKDVFSWLGTVRHLGLAVRETGWENEKEGKEGDNSHLEGRGMARGSSQKEIVIPKEMFSKAKTECYMIMRKDTFARWRITDQFSNFFDNLRPLASARISVLTDCCYIEGEDTGSAGTKAATTCFSSPSVMRQHSLLPGSGSGSGSGSMLSSQLKLKLQQSVDQIETGAGAGLSSEIRTILPFIGAVNRTPFE